MQLPPTPCTSAEVGLAFFAGASCAFTEPDELLRFIFDEPSSSDVGTEYPVAMSSRVGVGSVAARRRVRLITFDARRRMRIRVADTADNLWIRLEPVKLTRGVPRGTSLL